MPRILVVEDDEDVHEVVCDLLKCEKFDVEGCLNGTDASASLKTTHFDVIVMDWQLPDISGVDVIKEYRRDGGISPVLMLTGKTEIDDLEIGLDAGADDYLTKPFNGQELIARVRALLRRAPLNNSKLD